MQLNKAITVTYTNILEDFRDIKVLYNFQAQLCTPILHSIAKSNKKQIMNR